MSARRARAIGAALLLSTLLSGCTSDQDRREQAAVIPYLNVLAAKITELPNVTCAIGLLPDDGTGRTSSNNIIMDLTLNLGLRDPAVPGVLKAAGEVVWRSDLPVYRLSIVTFGGSVTLAEQVRGDTTASAPLTVPELTTLYGPKPSPPASLAPVTDPGRLAC